MGPVLLLLRLLVSSSVWTLLFMLDVCSRIDRSVRGLSCCDFDVSIVVRV